MHYRNGFALLLLFAAAITLCCLGLRELESGDETRVAGIAAEMFREGDYLLPQLNGKPFLEYPPLYYWCVSLAYQIFGVCDFASKLPSALSAMAAAAIIFLFGKKTGFHPWSCLFSGIIFLTGAQVFNHSRVCTVDMMLSMFILLALYSFYCLFEEKNTGKRFGCLLLFAASMFCAVMTKGLIGAVLPVSAIGIFLVIENFVRKKFRLAEYFWLGSGVAAALLSAAVWYYLLYRTHGETLLHTVLNVNNAGRFSGAQGDHVEPFYWYLKKLPSLFLPWLLLLPFSLAQAGRMAWKEKNSGRIYLLTFLFVPLLLLTIAASKRVVYLLPLYAAAALICGGFIDFHWEKIQKFWMERFNLPGKILNGIAALFFIGILLFQFSRIIPCVGLAFIGLYFLASGKNSLRVIFFLCTGACIYVSIDVVIAHFENRETLRPMFETVKKLEENGVKVLLKSPPERTCGAAYYYLGKNLEVVDSGTEVPPPDTAWIVRRKRNAPETGGYGDHHYIIRHPGQ